MALLLVIAVALALYSIRCRFRTFYGLNEALVGGFATMNVLASMKLDYSTLTLAHWLQVAAGLYLIVRGLDSIGVGLEQQGRGNTWRSVFEGR
jgi:hypothetical protein